MNREQARDLIQRTFTQKFDKTRFLNFTRNLLNHIDESKASSWNSQYVKDAFKNHVKRYERLGTYHTPKKEAVDLLVVYLTDGSKLERARTAIRNFVADHLKQRDEKDAALVAFVAPADNTWRFSYVKMEYAAVEKDSGIVGVEARLTPARRFSYIVGEGESCHTAQTRFLALLQDTATNATLADIEEAFSVEAVTKEFFTKYAELFEEIHKALDRLIAKEKPIRNEFTSKTVASVDFAKKLMGQIVFLYFLQKKGWLGVAKGEDWGTGPRDFLRRLAKGDYGKYDNFFNDILEPLFYDTLATDRGHEAWCNRFKCRIPFLNGGLFEPLGDYDWRKIDIALPNKLFTNSADFEEGITGTGVLDVFDRYNFTVNEAEPLEKEVAIDPEMLGKVFENLIEDNRRKGLGAYYTPRDIVHYMCQTSLINYLDKQLNNGKQTVPFADLQTLVRLGEQISHYEAVEAKYAVRMPKSIETHARRLDEGLADITICDPAVGSGAFLVGMMTEVVRARSALTPYFNDVNERNPYHFKRHAIQNCLYGVDIDLGAVEIAKLRLWLSLVVDEEETDQIKPLPNLLYKVVAGNSLLRVEKTLFNQKAFQELETLRPLFFDESDAEQKASLKHRIDDLIHQLTNGREIFDFSIYFSEVYHKRAGFDVMLANPPYVEFKNLAVQIKASLTGYVSTKGKYDLYIPFLERSVDLASGNSVITFICPTRFMHRDYGKAIRAFLRGNVQILEIIDFSDLQIFEGAMNYTGVFVFAKPHNANYQFSYRKFENDTSLTQTELAAALFDKQGCGHLPVVPISSSDLSSVSWYFGNSSQSSLIAKLKAAGKPLRDWCDGIYQGISTGKDEVFIVTSDELEEWSIEPEIIQPMLKGKDIKRYSLEWSEHFLVYPYDEQGKVFSEASLRSDFPNAYRYLQKMRPKLGGRGYFESSNKKWYELWNQRRLDRFKGRKIVTLDNASRNSFTLDDGGFLGTTTVYSVILNTADSNLYRFVLGLLNSSTLEYFHKKNTIPQAGGFFRYQASFIETMPICQAAAAKQAPIIELVGRILKAKKIDPAADTATWEREIDHLVYKLYGLSGEEIAVVEAN